MANHKVSLTIDLMGNAVKGVGGLAARIGKIGLGLHGVISSFSAIKGKLEEFSVANNMEQEAEAKLAQVMKNTMNAGLGEVAAIKKLASAQQQLGVIGDEVQLAGAQELGTYLSKKESLEQLMPVMGLAESESKANAFALPSRSKDGDRREPMICWRSSMVQKKRNPCEKGFSAKRLLLTGWCPSFWRLVIKEARGLFGRVVDVELTDELEAVLEVGSFGLGEGVKEAEGGDECDLLGLDGHVLLGGGDDLPEGGEEVLELMVGDKKLDFWRRNGVYGVVARVVEEVRDAVERACDGVVIIWKRDFYGGGSRIVHND